MSQVTDVVVKNSHREPVPVEDRPMGWKHKTVIGEFAALDSGGEHSGMVNTGWEPYAVISTGPNTFMYFLKKPVY